jgi:uncharacterized repeat protein (TIGR03803 family)
MQRKSFSKMVIFAILAVTLVWAAATWAADSEKVLYNFTNGDDGSLPDYSAMVLDKQGNLYGIAGAGGSFGLGAVFELSPNADGRWTETVLHSFAGGTDGAIPVNAGLVRDNAGNLYGVTTFGGGLGYCPNEGTNYYCGTVFELTPAGGQWQETVLFRFDNGKLGGYPSETLILDHAGNLYGSAALGTGCGGGGCGMVFELARSREGPWKEKILYAFQGGDGAAPNSPLLFDSHWNLYGTTISGGSNDAGVVFKLSPRQKGAWKETVLHNFAPLAYDGSRPCGVLAFDRAGNLYGSTQNGGKWPCGKYGPGCGVVYKLAHGTWKESILLNFRGGRNGVGNDTEGVALDSSGRIYGTASGSIFAQAAVFRLTRDRDGKWVQHILYNFGNNGVFPGMVVPDGAGNFYGTTIKGGTYGWGTVFEITP